MTRLRTAGLAAALCLLGLAATPSSAPAAVLSDASCGAGCDIKVYAGDAGETNTLTITFSGSTYTLTDTTATSLTGSASNCTILDSTPPTVVATCDDGGSGDNVDEIAPVLGDMNDFATAATVPPNDFVDVSGGDGDDTISGSQQDSEATDGDAGDDTFENPVGDTSGDTFTGGADTDTASYATRTGLISASIDNSAFDGESGENDNITTSVENLIAGSNNDQLTGNAGTPNVITGGAGNDNMRGDPSVTSATDGDTFIGGAGTADQVTYTNRAAAVNVTLDNVANDGQAGENDNVGPTGDVESLDGGSGADTLIGNGVHNVFEGSLGNDTLDGGGADDVLSGGSGLGDTVVYSSRTAPLNVSLDGDANDGEVGEEDNAGIGGPPDVEHVIGGSGNDIITGSSSANSLFGGAGTGYDRLTGNAGADILDGGAGIDRAIYNSTSTAASIIDIDNVADDTDGTGATTENVMDTIESITGGDALAGDTLTGSCFNNVLAGQGGNDTLNGDPTSCPGDLFGNDFMGGGTGNDTMLGSVTPSAIDGIDRVTYTANTAAQPTNITLDGTGNDTDGTGGVDNVGRDIEYLYGGPEIDNFSACGQGATPPAPLPCLPTGPQALQGVSFWGGLGDDILFGSDMNDYMDGQGGSDTVNCEGGSGDMNKTDGTDPAPVSCETAVP